MPLQGRAYTQQRNTSHLRLQWRHAIIGKPREAVLPRGPVPGGQCRYNITRDTTPPTSREEQCFPLSPCRGCIWRIEKQLSQWDPCGGGVEYHYRDPESCRRRRKGKSRIWDSKIWPRVLWDSDPKMTALARPVAIANDRTVLSSERAPQINKTLNCQTIIKIWS
jgi:hypothetical protein